MKNILVCFLSVAFLLADLKAQNVFVKHYGDFSGEGNCVIMDAQGNFLLAGNKNQGANMMQFCVYKINPNGDTIGLKYYGGAYDDYASKIIPTIDGGYALIGYTIINYTASCITFIKTQNSGTPSWSTTIGGLASEVANSIVQTSSGEYFIGGRKKRSNGTNDFYLIKTDINGDTLWTKRYGGYNDDEINSIILCSDGGILMAGFTRSFGVGPVDFYLVKVDSDGNPEWSKTYGDSLTDIAESVKQTPDGGYIIVGYKNYSYDTGDIFIVKTDSGGDTLWTRIYTANERCMTGRDVIATNDGGYMVLGGADVWQFIPPNITAEVRSDVCLLKFSNNGSLQGVEEFTVSPSNCLTGSYGNSIIQLPDNSYVIGGTYFNCSTFETMLIKTLDPALAIEKLEMSDFKIYPNPSNDKITFQFNKAPDNYSLALFDSKGLQVSATESMLTNQIAIEKGSLLSGIYFFQLKINTGQIYSGKIIFE